jgi:hypothetical protein
MGKRGKKNCPGCKKELGVRTFICPDCKYNFYEAKEKNTAEEKQDVKIEKKGKKEKKEKVVDPKIQEMLDNLPTYVAPIRLSSQEHAQRVLSYGENRARHLLKHARHEHCWGHVDWKVVEAGLS